MKVLVSAFACEPGQGSEPGVGWNFVSELARRHRVWVLTRANQPVSIEDELARCPIDGLTPVYFDLPSWLQWGNRGRHGQHLYYYLWQAGAYRVARQLHNATKFDIAHHVTIVKYWAPSVLCLLPVPFVWGPVGGGESTPPPLRRQIAPRGRVFEWLRSFARSLAHYDPFVRLTARRSHVALATTQDTAERLRRLPARRVQVCSQVGLCRQEFDALGKDQPPTDSPLTVISIGWLLHLKGFDLGLKAFAGSGIDGQYVIVGDGPERHRLMRLAGRLGIADRVRITGWLPRPEALRMLQEAHMLVHPSLHDSGGWVCLEAMAAGKPVICLATGGPAQQVTPECGYVVPALEPSMTIEGLTTALRRLAADPEMRRRMGIAGRDRVRSDFLWPAKVDHMERLYADVLGDTSRDQR